METLDLYIKNMVCSRCVYIVEHELEALGIKVLKIKLGCITIQKPEKLPEGILEERLKNYCRPVNLNFD
jgi:copper chaperone CopZ